MGLPAMIDDGHETRAQTPESGDDHARSVTSDFAVAGSTCETCGAVVSH